MKKAIKFDALPSISQTDSDHYLHVFTELGNFKIKVSDFGGGNGGGSVSLTIGTNGHFYIDGVDTGIPAVYIEEIIDYDYNITGVRNGINQVFKSSRPFKASTLSVFRDGGILTKGDSFDFQVGADNQTVTIYHKITDTTNLVFKYKELN